MRCVMRSMLFFLLLVSLFWCCYCLASVFRAKLTVVFQHVSPLSFSYFHTIPSIYFTDIRKLTPVGFLPLHPLAVRWYPSRCCSVLQISTGGHTVLAALSHARDHSPGWHLGIRLSLRYCRCNQSAGNLGSDPPNHADPFLLRCCPSRCSRSPWHGILSHHDEDSTEHSRSPLLCSLRLLLQGVSVDCAISLDHGPLYPGVLNILCRWELKKSKKILGSPIVQQLPPLPRPLHL